MYVHVCARCTVHRSYIYMCSAQALLPFLCLCIIFCTSLFFSPVSLKSDNTFIPHEFACLNHSVLLSAHNYTPPTTHSHFTLRQQPQASVQLRNEMLQKGVCVRPCACVLTSCVCKWLNPFSLPAEMDFAQTGSLVKDRHLLQRQMSATGIYSSTHMA